MSLTLLVGLATVGSIILSRQKAQEIWGTDQLAEARKITAEMQIQRLEKEVAIYKSMNDAYPNTLDELETNWALTKDPWGNGFHYGVVARCGHNVFIASTGPDGQIGTEDDISTCTSQTPAQPPR